MEYRRRQTGAFSYMVGFVFVLHLDACRENLALSLIAQTKANVLISNTPIMPRSKNPNYIDWAKSRSKKIVMDDLESGVLPLDDESVPASVAWEHYSVLPEFIQERVIYAQFEGALKRHRKAVSKRKRHFAEQLSALEHDTQFFYGGTHNRRGVKIFYGTEAHNLLKQDIKEGKHTTLGVEGLYYSRDEYCEEDDWDVAFFRRRVRQEDLTQKFHYYMDVQRAKKERQKNKSKQKANTMDEFEYYDLYQEEDEDEVDDDEVDEDADVGATTHRAASASAATRASTANSRPKRRHDNDRTNS